MGTHTLPCPYLPGRTERKVVTDLATPNASDLYETLSRAGFRRSHSLAYRPACPGCSACVPVRIAVENLIWTKTFRRIVNRNADLARKVCRSDAFVDDLTSQIFRELLSYMIEDPQTIRRAIRITFVAKYIERIADHATNVAEMVVYLVEGKIIRHTTI